MLDDLESLELPAPGDDEPYADERTMKAVRDYLAGLTPELRGVHEQRYVKGVSQEEAARALGLSRQQVRTLEERLRDGLAAHLKGSQVAADAAATNLASPTYGRSK